MVNKSREIKIICRCEDVSEDEIIEAIREGFTDFEELRRKLRIGMGPCQGRTCFNLVRKILIKELGLKNKDIKLPTSRPPIVPTPLGVFCSKEREGDNNDSKR